jgi:uncharacterized protein
MQYNVAQLLKEPIGSTRSYQLEETFTGSARFADWANGSVHFLRTHQGILVSAELESQVTLACGRCLSEFTLPLTLHVEEEFFPMVDVVTGRRLPQPAGSEGSSIDANHTLDLTEVLRQCVITSQPMKPLCSSDCPGLCQQCGANLNQYHCNCHTAQRDRRWGPWRNCFTINEIKNA